MRKINLNLNASSLLPILGLVVFLLISPCKVRNFIQQSAGISQTEVAHKNKSAFKASSCIDAVMHQQGLSKDKTPRPPLAIEPIQTYTEPVQFSYTTRLAASTTSANRFSPIPLYILYQQFKNYL